MTEDQIERRIERMMDALDREYCSTAMSDQEYNGRIDQIDAWAEAQLKQRRT
jgi:hypothetical protein